MNKPRLSDKIGQFATIPYAVIMRMPEIGAEAFMVFSYLRYRTNGQTDSAFPSYETIQKDTGLIKRRIARALRILIDAGLCERKRRFGKSTIYTLTISNTVVTNKKRSISNTVGTIISNPVGTLTRLNELDEKELATQPAIKTVDIKAAFSSCITYPINWAAGSGASAKWLAENGYTPDDVIGCYKSMAADPWWKDKEISLKNVANKIGAWKQTTAKRKVIMING